MQMKAKAKQTMSGVISFGKEYIIARIKDGNIVIKTNDGTEIGFTEEVLEIIPPIGYSKIKLKHSK